MISGMMTLQSEPDEFQNMTKEKRPTFSYILPAHTFLSGTF